MAVRTFQSFTEASTAVGPDEVVSGTYRVVEEGEDPYSRPVYFLTPKVAGPDLMRELAFEARHGKPMDGYQRSMLEEAKTRQEESVR